MATQTSVAALSIKLQSNVGSHIAAQSSTIKESLFLVLTLRLDPAKQRRFCGGVASAKIGKTFRVGGVAGMEKTLCVACGAGNPASAAKLADLLLEVLLPLELLPLSLLFLLVVLPLLLLLLRLLLRLLMDSLAAAGNSSRRSFTAPLVPPFEFLNLLDARTLLRTRRSFVSKFTSSTKSLDSTSSVMYGGKAAPCTCCGPDPEPYQVTQSLVSHAGRLFWVQRSKQSTSYTFRQRAGTPPLTEMSLLLLTARCLLTRHSNCSASRFSVKPRTAQSTRHGRPQCVAFAPPLHSPLCCLRRRARSLVMPV